MTTGAAEGTCKERSDGIAIVALSADRVSHRERVPSWQRETPRTLRGVALVQPKGLVRSGATEQRSLRRAPIASATGRESLRGKEKLPTFCGELRWCSRRDLNPYGFPSEPKSDASANFATAAPHYYITRRRYVKHLPFPTNFCKFHCENSCILPRCLIYYISLAGVTQW